MKKIFWIDMEMSGLEVEKEAVIEVGAVITDLEFNALEDYHAIVKQPQHYIDNMDDWNKEHHGRSGLLALIPDGQDPQKVESDLCELVRRHFPDPQEPPVIAGNSIYQDRTFINAYFKKLAARLHYRMLDVSSWKIIMESKYGLSYEKKNGHRALDDILESIAELKEYMQYIQVD